VDNDEGEGSDDVTSPYQSPQFSHPLSDTITLQANEKHVFKCLFSGVPLPEIEWKVGGQLLEVTR
jgi:hypothetical protein